MEIDESGAFWSLYVVRASLVVAQPTWNWVKVSLTQIGQVIGGLQDARWTALAIIVGP